MTDYNKNLISEDSNIINALETIEKSEVKIAIIVDANRILKGTATDGDIRRGLIRGETLHSNITSIMNSSPTYSNIKERNEVIEKVLVQKGIEEIPLVDEALRVVGVFTKKSRLTDKWIERDVVIMCGGLGSRLGDLTKNCPKPLLKVGDKPILESIIERFCNDGCRSIYLSVNYQSEKIIDYFGDGSKWGISIKYLEEKKKLGTAGSLSLLDKPLKKSFVVMNGDILTNVNFDSFISFHESNNATASMCVREYDFQVPYGVVKLDSTGKVLSIEEKPKHKFFVSAGVYLLNPQVLELLKPGENLDMPDLFERVKKQEGTLYSFPIHEYWLDIGRVDDFEKAKMDIDTGIYK